MNKIVFNNKSFDLANNGLSVSNTTLVLTIASEDFDEVEAACAPVTEIVQKLEDGTKVASYKGYTKLMSINKQFNKVIDIEHSTHEDLRPKTDPETGEYIIDPDTGEAEMETYLVTDDEPVYGTVIVVTLLQPTLEDVVTDLGEQITEIQEVLAELM
jgi:hypothetical protein